MFMFTSHYTHICWWSLARIQRCLGLDPHPARRGAASKASAAKGIGDTPGLSGIWSNICEQMHKCTECITILSNFAGDGWTLQMVFGLDGKSFFFGHSAARTRAWGLQCATPGVERCVMACHIAVTVSMCLHVHLFQLSIILGSS